MHNNNNDDEIVCSTNDIDLSASTTTTSYWLTFVMFVNILFGNINLLVMLNFIYPSALNTTRRLVVNVHYLLLAAYALFAAKSAFPSFAHYAQFVRQLIVETVHTRLFDCYCRQTISELAAGVSIVSMRLIPPPPTVADAKKREKPLVAIPVQFCVSFDEGCASTRRLLFSPASRFGYDVIAVGRHHEQKLSSSSSSDCSVD